MTQISNQPTIKDFLLARIAEDEAAADVLPGETLGCMECGFVDGRRILAEIAAKRAIIGPPVSEDLKAWGHGVGASPDTLRTLAAIYSDHPDYQKEWAGQA